ncbi:unnamed protein product (macronuclear) [Paramecium tetraurelia]|uniref:Uncharacterized protein n=1 Tax=Paramecium tetraurelia TaxID=5888 RepID=A0C0E3_PARTE|nr:uncharacterized protein GSPATT00006113001 [Paramecium tetraurelia]CAK64260.1 unnamed protein product [Paramecium tetraurelia]|eukprot:XP_001431658.1 hypothetical protein (macronuclear) [Paramecium tetraurelia strain d4-2]
MGSACQKVLSEKSEKSENQEIDDFDQRDYQIEKEQYPLKVHKGGRKALHKSKRLPKNIECDEVIQESMIYSFDQIHQQQKSDLQKSTYSNSEKNLFVQEDKKQLIGIMKQQRSYQLIQSSLKGFSTLNSKRQLSSPKIKDHQARHVRFKLPKSHKQQQRTHSKIRNRINSQPSYNL